MSEAFGRFSLAVVLIGGTWLLVVLGLVIGARRGWWGRRDLWP
jgi:hypothetical protein